jgi:hypothetical protein
MSKNLLILTGHRQFKEIELYAKFIQRTEQLKNFDIIVHLNSLKGITNYKYEFTGYSYDKIVDYFNLFPNENKHLILTDKNCGGPLGPHQALDDLHEIMLKYNNVIHAHLDVFLVNEKLILNILESEPEKAFLVSHVYPSIHDWMSTDLFVYRPQNYKENIFRDWSSNLNQTCEGFLYSQIISKNISYSYLKRYDDDNWHPRRPCMWGFYHEHDLDKVESLL